MREMKDSGISTIGMIPSEWDIVRLKYLCRFQTGNEDTQNANPDGLYDFYVRSPIVEKCDRYTFNGEGILVAGDGAGAGRIFHHVFGKYAVHQRVYRLSEFKCNSNLLHYYLESLFPYEMDKGSAQSTVPSMRLPMLLNFPVLMPSPNEATKIANYLDQKCSEIDAITKDIQSQIDTLEQYKRSVITEAVTKGLDPDVEMKDSGVEWIGEVPVEWNIIQLKYLLNEPMKYGATESGVDYDESLIRYIRITDIDSSGNLKETGKLSLTPQQAFGFILKNNTILYARSGGTVGKTFLYTTDCGKAAFAGYLISAVANPKIALPKWIMYYSNSNAYWNWVNSIFSQATIQNIGADKYSKMPLPLPDIALQKTIISYLDDKCFKIDALIKDKQTQLTTLADYKKSLIYEYVTGKKEVPVE